MPYSLIEDPPDLPEDIRRRKAELFRWHLHEVSARTDRMFAVLMILQWIGGIITALLISPRTWSGTESSVHIHVWAAILLGGVLSSFPLYCVARYPGQAVTRHVIAAAQMLWSALLIHLSGGRIETHFHVFGSLAFLAVYRDWKVLLTATVVVGIDHGMRGALWPQSVFGVLWASPLRTLEHVWWVLFEDVFLFHSIRRSLQEMHDIADRRAHLESTNQIIEAQVRKRTAELEAQKAALVEATHRAEAATQAKSDFLANMSHEIRTPMTAILGFTEILLDQDLNDSDRLNAIHTVRRNGRHLLTLINDILDLSKIEAGKLDIERIASSTRRMLYDVAALLRGRAEEKGIALKVEIVGQIPETIQTDPTRLRQALVNLVGNAIKFSDEGAVRIIAACDVEDQRIYFHVTDQGVGIRQTDLDLIFRPFHQADASTTRRFGGTGLGLAITRRIAELLGGQVRVQSTPGVGSCFSIILPTGALDGVAMVTAADSEPMAAEAPAQLTELPTLDARILLAEDGVDNQRLIRAFLRKAGAAVSIVENGQAAVQVARKAVEAGQPFDLILMDMQMPLMDGYEATRRLRRGGYSGLIMALTAHAMKGEMEKCLKAGCDGYLSKPIDRDALIREAAARLKRVRGSPEPAAAL